MVKLVVREELKRNLESSDPFLRASTIRELKKEDLDWALPSVIKLLNDESKEVRFQTLQYLLIHLRAKELPKLIKSLKIRMLK